MEFDVMSVPLRKIVLKQPAPQKKLDVGFTLLEMMHRRNQNSSIREGTSVEFDEILQLFQKGFVQNDHTTKKETNTNTNQMNKYTHTCWQHNTHHQGRGRNTGFKWEKSS